MIQMQLRVHLRTLTELSSTKQDAAGVASPNLLSPAGLSAIPAYLIHFESIWPLLDGIKGGLPKDYDVVSS